MQEYINENNVTRFLTAHNLLANYTQVDTFLEWYDDVNTAVFTLAQTGQFFAEFGALSGLFGAGRSPGIGFKLALERMVDRCVELVAAKWENYKYLDGTFWTASACRVLLPYPRIV